MPTMPRMFRVSGAVDGAAARKAGGQLYDAARGSSAARGYGSAWRKARLGHLRSETLCRSCFADGFVIVGTEVDHIVPHRGDQALFWDRANWQTLCKSCHSKKTGGGQ